MHDAVDVIVSRLLMRETVEPIQGFTQKQRERHKCIQHEVIASHEAYGGLFNGGTKALAGTGRIWKKLSCTSQDVENASAFTFQ